MDNEWGVYKDHLSQVTYNCVQVIHLYMLCACVICSLTALSQHVHCDQKIHMFTVMC